MQSVHIIFHMHSVARTEYIHEESLKHSQARRFS